MNLIGVAPMITAQSVGFSLEQKDSFAESSVSRSDKRITINLSLGGHPYPDRRQMAIYPLGAAHHRRFSVPAFSQIRACCGKSSVVRISW